MIILTRLGAGLTIAVNPDLIERVEQTPDSVITLIDGHKLVVEESVDRIVDMVRTWRASVAAEAITIHRQADVEDDTPVRGQTSDAVVADHANGQTPGARVLRLHSREV